jgi:hypothetical protein
MRQTLPPHERFSVAANDHPKSQGIPMRQSRLLTKPITTLTLSALIWSSLIAGPAHAAFSSTVGINGSGATATVTTTSEARARVNATLAREELRAALNAQGVSVADAQARVDAMTEADVAALDKQLAELPAGGDGFSTVVLILLVLIITDLLGVTDVFPAIKPAR